jgi:hypothetical protein
MSYAIWGMCQHCGTIPQLVPTYSGFAWWCKCPPPQTTTSDGTGAYVPEQKPAP